MTKPPKSGGTIADSSPEFPSEIRLINSAQLHEIIPVSKMTIWRWEQEGIWPERIKINGRCFWRLAEVLDSIDRAQKGGGVNAP